MQTATVKQEPMESSSSEADLPVDMTLAQRDALYKSMTCGAFRPSPHDSAPVSKSSGFDKTHERERLHHRMFQAQLSASLSQHVLSTPYGQHLYPHSHIPEDNSSRRTCSNKRKQPAPLPQPVAAPPLHQSPPSHLQDPEDTPHMREIGKDDVMNMPLVMGKDWRSSSMSGEPRLQPRASSGHQRARREFVPDEKKDTSYWCKRLKNNDSARRSRVKRKALEKLMESRLLELQKENIELRHEMAAMERRYNVKRNSSGGEEDTEVSDTSQGSAGGEDVSQMARHDSPSPPPAAEKLSRDEELECASNGSDDSRSNDDSRMYSVGSVSALHRSLGLTSRERADSIASNSSSLASHRVSATSSRPTSSMTRDGAGIRLDRTGALDLTSDHSNRSTPARESPDNIKYRPFSGVSSETSSLEEAAAAMRSMKNFPPKCRWKREMQSAHVSPVEERRDCQ